MTLRRLGAVPVLALAWTTAGCEESIVAPATEVTEVAQPAMLARDIMLALPELGSLGLAVLDAMDRVLPGLGEDADALELRGHVEALALGLLAEDRVRSFAAHRAAAKVLGSSPEDGDEAADLSALRLVLDAVEAAFDGDA